MDIAISSISALDSEACAQSEEGVDFVDAYAAFDDANMQVIDSGRITMTDVAMDQLVAAAKRQGLVVEEES